MTSKPFKPILCLDFDGVIHSYISGWQGITKIPDDPTPGALEFVNEMIKYFDVQIFSTRSRQEVGRKAMSKWMQKHNFPIEQLSFPKVKPAAHLIIDDRAMLFTGVWPTLEAIQNFKPWFN